MAFFNHAAKEITAKLVYYGPGLCGKTTNLQWIHEQTALKSKGKLVSLATQTDRTLFFDFLPVELGTIRGLTMRMQIYTVPGQVFYESTRRMVLKGCDAVVFVCDSQAAMLEANGESLQSLRRNLVANDIDPLLPMVLQYNKRDLPTALPVDVLNARLNPRKVPYFEAVAVKGIGVEETFRAVTRLLFKSLTDFVESAASQIRSETGKTPPPAARPATKPPAADEPLTLSSDVLQERPNPATIRVKVASAPAPPGVASTPARGTPAASRTAKPALTPIPEPQRAEAPPAGHPAAPQPRPAPAEPRPTPAASVAPAPSPPPRPVAPEPAGAMRPAPPPKAAEPTPPEPAASAEPAPKAEGLRAEQWVYLLAGTQRGPVELEDLIDLILTSVPEDTKVWHPGQTGWMKANLIPEIADHVPPPLPSPGLLPSAGTAYAEEDFPDFNTVPAMLRTALIADEDGAFRRFLAMPLAAQGFTIYEAADGAAAWQLAVQHRPWLVLADISMPEVDGFEFARRVRNHPILSHTPLLFISGSDKYKERYRALQLGADDFLSKQMPIRELLIRIQLLLTRYSDLGGAGQKQPGAEAQHVEGALEGQIEVFGAPALLQICNQGRLSGLFTARAGEGSDAQVAVFGFRGGEIISATNQDQSGVEAVYGFLSWEKGQFKFTPGDPGEGTPLAQSVEHLLLEGCRLLDEARRGAEEEGASL